MSNAVQWTRECLTKYWRGYENLKLEEKDLDAGIEILTQIALKTFSKEPPEEMNARIKEFIKQNAYRFRSICKTGFPFSKLKSEDVEPGMRGALEKNSSFLYHLLQNHEKWMQEKTLNRRFGEVLKELNSSALKEACEELAHAYLNEDDLKSGYYLLWLIKNRAGCDYKMPGRRRFDVDSVEDVLSQYIEKKSIPAHPTHFVEILHSGLWLEQKSLYDPFLNESARTLFRDFVIEQLKSNSMASWPGKSSLLKDLIITGSHAERTSLAAELSLSKDETTAEIGWHLLKALKAASLNESLPHFKELKKLWPKFDKVDIRLVFNKYVEDFLQDRWDESENPAFTHLLNFNDPANVVVQGSLMLGVFASNSIIYGKKVLPSLFAFDLVTKEPVWALSLKQSKYKLQLLESRLALYCLGDNQVQLIDIKSGAFNAEIEMPAVFESQFECLHMTPQGCVYQLESRGGQRILHIGSFVEEQWRPSFLTPAPDGFLIPLSTHCGFQLGFGEEVMIYGPQGNHATIIGCKEAQAYGDKLFTIEIDPKQKERCLLAVRSLKMDREVVGPVEKTVSLQEGNWKFGGLCQNGQLILLSYQAVLFVDLKADKVNPVSYKLPSNGTHVINPFLGELWFWDEFSQELWKVTSAERTLMDTLKGARGTTLIHADNAGQLYYMHRPY